MKQIIFAVLFVCALSACEAAQPNLTLVPFKTATTEKSTASASVVTQTVENPKPSVTLQATDVPAATESGQAVGDRLMPKYWREWPSVPVLSTRAKDILLAAIANPALDLHTFSRVGDCQLTSETFLGGYVNGKYPIPDGFVPTVEYFSASFITESITARNGLGVNSVLNPIFAVGAGYKECGANETPLDCELRIRRPTIVIVAMGTNWVPHGEVRYEMYLRQVVDRILQTGALPILATKADNIEGDWKLNQAVAQVAYDDNLPLVNVWRSVQDLPNYGLEAPKNIYLTGDAWMRRNNVWLQTLALTKGLLDGN